MNAPRILVECYADEKLVSKFIKIKIEHTRGKAKLFGKLEKKQERRLLALIDYDPQEIWEKRRHRYLKALEDAKKYKEYKNGKLVVYIDPKAGHKIIALNPKLEDWLIDNCKKAKVNPKDFGLPSDPEKLGDIIRVHEEKFPKGFIDLLNLLAEQSSSFKQLKKLLNE